MSDLFRVRESKVQSDCVKYAKKKGWRGHKLVSPGKRGKTDYFFTKSCQRIFFVEFKRDEHEDATAQQLREQQKLRDEGFSVFVIQYYEEFCALVDSL